MKLKKETMSKHFIYHIFGKKIGVTNNIVRRMKQQNVKEGEYEILEEHTNAKTASVREQELQEQHGYRVDTIPYWKTIRNAKKAHTPEANAKRVANTDYKAKVANTDYKLIHVKRSAKISKPVLQYDKQDNFIKEWNSAKEAAKNLNLKQPNINVCLKNGKQKTTGGYKWKFAN